LFQSARRARGAEALGIGVPLLLSLLVGSALFAFYRSPECQPVLRERVAARTVRCEFDRKNWDAARSWTGASSVHR
jgi:hypothetical protein